MSLVKEIMREIVLANQAIEREKIDGKKAVILIQLENDIENLIKEHTVTIRVRDNV